MVYTFLMHSCLYLVGNFIHIGLTKSLALKRQFIKYKMIYF